MPPRSAERSSRCTARSQRWVVDLNSIPPAAVERIEVLEAMASSSLYGTDAIGGGINFILRRDFTGVSVQGVTDTTEKPGGNVICASVVAGFGDLAKRRLQRHGIGVAQSQPGAARRSAATSSTPSSRIVVSRWTTHTAHTVRHFAFAISSAPFGFRTLRARWSTVLGRRNRERPLYERNQPADLPIAGCSSIDGMGACDELPWRRQPPGGLRWYGTPAVRQCCSSRLKTPMLSAGLPLGVNDSAHAFRRSLPPLM